MSKQLIVGIDPGTTVGYAVLDLDGNLITIGSVKHCPLNELISSIIKIGDTILVGTDRKFPPYFVAQFATKVGAKVINPKNDLLVSEKRIATSAYKTNNYHELDALASAIYANNEIKPLLNKIDEFIRIYDKLHLRDSLRKKVILEGINIKHAAKLIESQSSIEMVPEVAIKNKEPNLVGDIGKLKNKIKLYESDIEQSTRYNKKLLGEIRGLKAKVDNISKISQIVIERKVKSAIHFKEQKINLLLKKLEQKDDVIYNLKNSVDRLNIIISDIKNNLIIKKLPNLNYHVYELYNKVLNVQHGDILLVDNPSEYSQQTIEILKDKVGIIIYKTPLKSGLEQQLPFILISGNGIRLIEDKFFGTVNKSLLEQKLKEQNLLSRVIENYRKSRNA